MNDCDRPDIYCYECRELIIAGEGKWPVEDMEGEIVYVHANAHGGRSRSCFDIHVGHKINGSGMQ